MKIIIKGRKMGKTNELIQRAIETGAVIVTHCFAEQRRIEERLSELPFPYLSKVMTFADFVVWRGRGLERPYVIDNLDLCLQQFAGRNKILAVTFTEDK